MIEKLVGAGFRNFAGAQICDVRFGLGKSSLHVHR